MKIALVIALMLTGTASALANEANERLVAMSEADRHGALADTARKAGSCDDVVRSMLLGEDAERALWTVACRDGNEYAINVYADPKLKPFAMACEDLKDFAKLLGIMERRTGQTQHAEPVLCWKKL
ncbi:MAG TPA: hypothetical protein VFW22_13625 [Pseudolabrys sp.]|nr:hypothetical protein [Pseudolabrys sp.]